MSPQFVLKMETLLENEGYVQMGVSKNIYKIAKAKKISLKN